MSTLEAARVQVPCSTSNLGSGFDTIGLALGRYLHAEFVPESSEGVRVERSGTLERLGPDDGTDLVAEAFRSCLARDGLVPRGLLRLHSDIPVARGLGASAAASVAGHALALAVSGNPNDPTAAFEAAMASEGHGDNAAPSAFGGLVAVASGADGSVRVIPLPLASKVGFAYAAPGVGVSTREARALLPERVTHRVAAAGLGRVVALVRGLAEGDPDLIRVGALDELHVRFRLALIPEGERAIEAGLEAGAWAVTVSGAGSGLIAIGDPAAAEDVAAAMRDVFVSAVGEDGCVGFAVEPAMDGVRRV